MKAIPIHRMIFSDTMLERIISRIRVYYHSKQIGSEKMDNAWDIRYHKIRGNKKMTDFFTVSYLMAVCHTEPEAWAELKKMIANAENEE